jgi:hypothetical protein
MTQVCENETAGDSYGYSSNSYGASSYGQATPQVVQAAASYNQQIPQFTPKQPIRASY